MADASATTPNTLDDRWMSEALDLARKGIGQSSPNPSVGCVIVRESHLVGSGFHEYARRDHAEIVALREAGDLARGATAYVTLEPCSHHGRTGPCADALIAAGIVRVVVATADANPAVHGQGIARLRAAGIEVKVGVLQQPAQRLNDAFAKFIRTGLPFVTLKAAITLDGRIAPAPASSKQAEISWITGTESRQQVHRLRHSADAVLTGIGTVIADDPLLTDRSGRVRRRPLLRVILDSHLRLPPDSKLVRSAASDLLIFTRNPPEDRFHALTAAGVKVKQVSPESGAGSLNLVQVLKELGEMQITSLMVEGGSQINSAFLSQGLVDRLYLFYAPAFLGADAQPLLSTAPPGKPSIRESALHRFGADFALEAWLDNPWQS